MKRFLLVAVCSLGALSVFSTIAQSAATQATTASTETPQAEAVLTNLSPPVYPPLARQASISGDVKVELLIRKDGSVESAQVVSGHPMLKGAALESARQSHFECRGCGDGVTTLSLTYAFETRDDGDCCSAWPRTPEVTQARDRIAIVAAHICICDPSAIVGKRVRAAKCLYLWKCSLSER